MKTHQPATSRKGYALPLLGLVAIGVYAANEAGLLRSRVTEAHATTSRAEAPPPDDFEFDDEYFAIVQALTAQDQADEDSEEIEQFGAWHDV